MQGCQQILFDTFNPSTAVRCRCPDNGPFDSKCAISYHNHLRLRGAGGLSLLLNDEGLIIYIVLIWQFDLLDNIYFIYRISFYFFLAEELYD